MEDMAVSSKVSAKRTTNSICVAASTTVGELQAERKLQIASGKQKFLSKG